MPVNKDVLYSNPIDSLSPFKFDETVVNIFPDMLQRSIPGYSTIIYAIGLLAERHAQAHSVCYDLGCSLGAVAISMYEHITTNNCKIIAVDSSKAMLKQFRKNLKPTTTAKPELEILCADICDISIENASVVVLNFTLQFIPIKHRKTLLNKIYHGLLPNGILILSEKLGAKDLRQQNLQVDLHHAFKNAQGYSNLEISQKRLALENVLLAESFSTHKNRLKAVGFNSIFTWFQYFNFASIIALK